MNERERTLTAAARSLRTPAALPVAPRRAHVGMPLLLLAALILLLALPILLASHGIRGALPSLGGGMSTKVLRPTNPHYSDLYVSIKAPSPFADDIAKWAVGDESGFIAVSKAQGTRVCSYQGTLTSINDNVNDNFAIALYGSNPHIPAMCKALALTALNH
jgi:hypothetical protein